MTKRADRGILHLTSGGAPPQLLTDLVDEPEAPVAALGELATGSVEREVASESDPLAALEERASLAARARSTASGQ